MTKVFFYLHTRQFSFHALYELSVKLVFWIKRTLSLLVKHAAVTLA